MLIILQEGEFDWSEAAQGAILSAFFWGYVLTQVPGGLLAERVGGKHTLLLGILISTICTLLTPIAAREGGVLGLIEVRIIMGIGQVSISFELIFNCILFYIEVLQKCLYSMVLNHSKCLNHYSSIVLNAPVIISRPIFSFIKITLSYNLEESQWQVNFMEQNQINANLMINMQIFSKSVYCKTKCIKPKLCSLKV